MGKTKTQISLRSLISAFVVRCQDSIILLVFISENSSLCLASVAAQVGWVYPGHKPRRQVFLCHGSFNFHFFIQVHVIEVKGLKSLAPNKIVYCTMEVEGGEKLQTDQAEASKPRYHKNPKNLDTWTFAVISLKFEQSGFTIEYCIQRMQMALQTV